LSISLPLETQIRYATEFFSDLMSTYARKRFPRSALRQTLKVWRTAVGPVSMNDCADGVDYLVRVGKIRIIEETSEFEITDKFGILPKVKVEIEFDRELRNQYQAELKKLEEAHGLLYQLENELRRFIARTLSSIDVNWMNNLVEENVAKKWESRKEQEKDYPWLRPLDHDLIYYSDFKDLEQIVSRNWQSVFSKKISPKVREILVSRIIELEPIRNIIAHNRKISDEALNRLKDLSDDFSAILDVETQ